MLFSFLLFCLGFDCLFWFVCLFVYLFVCCCCVMFLFWDGVVVVLLLLLLCL